MGNERTPVGGQGRPRILFLVHRIPFPPDKGDKIRSWNELHALSRAADVALACFLDRPEDSQPLPSLAPLCREIVALPLARWPARARAAWALAAGGPLSLAFYRSREMERRVRDLGNFDAVLAFSSTMGPYGLAARAARRVLDLCDLDSAKWGQYAGRARFPMSAVYRLESERLGAYEIEAAARYDATLLVSEAESAPLRRACPEADVRIVRNGVDLEFFDPAAFDARGDARTVVFCGAMDYHSNVDAVCFFHDEVLPLVRRQVADAQFRIVGSDPAPAVQRLAASPGVTVTGRVPDVRPEICSAAVSVAPMRLGRGVPNKVLEALALTLPVVATPNAAAGLGLDAFEGADVAPDAAGIAEAVVRRLRAAREGNGRYPQHRDVLRREFSWQHHMAQLLEIVLP